MKNNVLALEPLVSMSLCMGQFKPVKRLQCKKKMKPLQSFENDVNVNFNNVIRTARCLARNKLISYDPSNF